MKGRPRPAALSILLAAATLTGDRLVRAQPSPPPPDSGPAVIRGGAFFDATPDGTRDSTLDYPVGGLPVWLFTCDERTLVSTARTEPSGDYEFGRDGKVEAGASYYVTVHPPSWYALSPVWAGIADGVDNVVDPATGNSDCFVVPPGGLAEGVDVGVVFDLGDAPAVKPPVETARPTADPSFFPSLGPIGASDGRSEPTARPTAEPTARPTDEPTGRPSPSPATDPPTAKSATEPPTARPTSASWDGPCPAPYSDSPNVSYESGDAVEHGGTAYQCIQGGRCNLAGFEPYGSLGGVAWKTLGPCEGANEPGSSESPTAGPTDPRPMWHPHFESYDEVSRA